MPAPDLIAPTETEAGAAPAIPSPRQSRALHLPRPGAHWTPGYVLDRVRWGLWQRRHPQEPWLVPGAVHVLDQALRPTDVMVEFGSGRSTRWFARRVGRIISIEHHAEWAAEVRAMLRAAGLSNAEVIESPPTPAEYPAAAAERLAGAADVVLVDGLVRDHCALWALSNVRPGGMLVIDNANWYLPSRTRAPASIGEHGRPKGELWQRFWDQTSHWRRVWFTNGINDTLIMLVPAG